MKKTLQRFKGTTAVITGGASGIGRAFAEELASHGSKVFIADRQIKLAQEVALKVKEKGGEPSFTRQIDIYREISTK